MKQLRFLLLVFSAGFLCLQCSKKTNTPVTPPGEDASNGLVETTGSLSYKVYALPGQASYKGILVMGSGNDENNPTVGSLTGGPENELCKKASDNGYVAAIVAYRKTAGVADWNTSSEQIGEDYGACVVALATKYGVAKENSVVGGYSFASYIMLTNNAYYNSLPYCKGLLAACGATGSDEASKFHIPVFSIACSGNNEGDFCGQALFDQIPAGSAIKSLSAGVTDNSCNTHCGGNWVDQLYAQLTAWLP